MLFLLVFRESQNVDVDVGVASKMSEKYHREKIPGFEVRPPETASGREAGGRDENRGHLVKYHRIRLILAQL